MKTKFKLYGEFSKVEEQEDGTLKVSGIASSEAVDSDGEVITADAMKAAIPDYMAFGAVREMHTSWAAGTALKCEVDDQNRTQFECLVVDAEAIKKVQAGVYKGFSIGGKVAPNGRDPLDKKRITGIKLVEVSLVDRPANPEAVFSMGKVDDAEESTLGTLRKGMWGVSRFSDLLQSLAYIATDAQFEAEYEGDSSPLPAELGAWVERGLELLQAMTAEEAAELAAILPKAPAVAVVMAEKGEGADDLAKAGAKYSKATREAVKTLRSKLTELSECMKAFDDVKDDEEEEDESAKAAASEALQKAAGLQEELSKALSEVDSLTKRVTELEAQPEPPKGIVKVLDVEKQAEMFQQLNKAAVEARADDLAKYNALPDGEEKYKASIRFTHRWGAPPA